MNKKSAIRKEMPKKLKNQDAKSKIEKDKVIKEKLLALPEFKEAEVIAFYVSFSSEVDTKELIDKALSMGKRVVVPAVAGKDLKFSEINCNKPFSKEKIDLVVVPGVAFTKSGSRLGRGKGFYDRFLKELPRRIKRVGLAYDIQITEDLPVAPHDSPIDIIITN